MAFQSPENQFVTGSVGDELLAALPAGIGEAERIRLVQAELAVWGLSGMDHRHPFELSQGQKRRLALATLTITDRWPLLVLDEPMAGLDAATAAILFDLIAMRARAGRAIVLITHDMDVALRLCRRSIVLGDGRILADGPTADLMLDRPLLARAGLAEPVSAPARRWLQEALAC
jgi:energy-coupling factor transport system ATP-binding protein